jgi:signal-transduction protein with cAMP-binding, CBS, and nucleotidyltransferase domain
MLSNKVSEIMTTNLITAPVSACIFEVLEMMVAEDVGRTIITDAEVPVGIFTEKDVLKRVISAKIDVRKTAIRQVMTSPVRAVREETHIVDAFAKMYRGKFRHLLVRGRRGKIIGIVSMRRILNLAVELGQGMSESRTLGDIAAPEVVSVVPSTTVYETVELMNRRSVAAVVVGEKGDKPSGIFTERDALKRVATMALDIMKTAVKQVMTTPIVTMPRTAVIGNVLAEMYRRDIRNMPVCDDHGTLTGLVSMPEVLQYAQAFNIDEQVRRTWKEVAEYMDTEDQYTPG